MAEICPVCNEEITSESREEYKFSSESKAVPVHNFCLGKFASKPGGYFEARRKELATEEEKALEREKNDMSEGYGSKIVTVFRYIFLLSAITQLLDFIFIELPIFDILDMELFHMAILMDINMYRNLDLSILFGSLISFILFLCCKKDSYINKKYLDNFLFKKDSHGKKYLDNIESHVNFKDLFTGLLVLFLVLYILPSISFIMWIPFFFLFLYSFALIRDSNGKKYTDIFLDNIRSIHSIESHVNFKDLFTGLLVLFLVLNISSFLPFVGEFILIMWIPFFFLLLYSFASIPLKFAKDKGLVNSQSQVFGWLIFGFLFSFIALIYVLIAEEKH